PTRRHSGDSRCVSGGRRRHCIDQHVRLRAVRPRRVRPRRAGLRALAGRGPPRPRGRRRTIRRRCHGSGDALDLGRAQRTLGRGARGVRGPGARPDRRRRGRAPARDPAGHAEREGRRHRRPPRYARGGGGSAPHGQRHDRADGYDARGPGRGGALRRPRAPRPLRHRPQLRDRPRVHDRPPPDPLGDGHPLRQRLPERGAAGRARPVRRDAREPRVQDAALRGQGWVNIVGGCCGTTPAHTRALRALVAGRPPRVPAAREPQAVSGIEVIYPTDDNRPLFVGERTNVIGSRRFKELIVAGEFEEAAEIGRAQVKNGAQVLDVCLANPDRDEAADMDRFMAQLTRKVKVPLMIDSTDAGVIELALRHCQGKAIVNSINLEDGEERFAKVVPLLRTYGGAVVVGTIDEDKRQGMAVTRARKLAIAERSHDLLTKKYGVPARDLLFDALVFPVGTGDANYIGSAVETIEGIRAIKARFPECKTILEVSNVSFGLPTAGRAVVNSVFLYHATKAGLDSA